ncbi:MAG TPA: ABC transporter ATP-binding protein [Isosphaeraceae bacterium]|nr:ABC transporter ATP-binding protein [Isosphaeraceae bacterium]
MKRRRKLEGLRGIALEFCLIAQRGRQVWRLVSWRHRLALGGALLIMSLASVSNTAVAVGVGQLIDAANPKKHPDLSPQALMQVAARWLAFIGGVYLVREAMNVLRRYLVENTCTRIDKDTYVRVVAHLMKVDLTVLAQDRIGGLYGRINRSVEGLVRFLRIAFLDFVPALLTGGFALGAALWRDPRVGLAMMGVIPVSLGLTLWQILTQKGVRIDLLRTRERMDGTVVEQLGGIDYVRAAHTHRQEVRRVAQAAERRRAKELRHHFEMSLFGSGKAINEGFFHVLVLGFAVYLFTQGRLESGEIMMFSMLFLSVMTPLSEIHRFLDEAHESSLRVGDLLGLLSVPMDQSFRTVEPGQPRLVLGEPLFVSEDLQVEFPTAGRPSRRALNGLTVTVRHGETIGVAGRTGGGKTTWLRTLMRLAHPCAGQATLGGVPLARISRQTIGELIGYVGQNPFVFAGTIAQNIAYGCPQATARSIRHAAKLACIHQEIMKMPGGYKAPVAERGQNLSGGQRQRIALARIFLKNPPILILDEGTSALDNQSERRVQNAIDAARADRTVILVAHRLTTLRKADRILVFDEGRIAEIGTYAELVQRGGIFAELVHLAEGHDPNPASQLDLPATAPADSSVATNRPVHDWSQPEGPPAGANPTAAGIV